MGLMILVLALLSEKGFEVIVKSFGACDVG